MRRTVAGVQPSCSRCCGVTCSCTGSCVHHVRHSRNEGGGQALLLLGQVVRVATAQTPYAATPAGKRVRALWLAQGQEASAPEQRLAAVSFRMASRQQLPCMIAWCAGFCPVMRHTSKVLPVRAAGQEGKASPGKKGSTCRWQHPGSLPRRCSSLPPACRDFCDMQPAPWTHTQQVHPSQLHARAHLAKS